jgi:hypothetical protein
MKSAPGSSKSHDSRSQKRNNKWYSHTDLVTFDVFKREYWPHLGEGIGLSYRILHLHTLIPLPKHHPWHSAIFSVLSLAVACNAGSELPLLQERSKVLRNLWTSQTVLSTELRTKVLGARTSWITRYLKPIKNSGLSAASAILQIGKPPLARSTYG